MNVFLNLCHVASVKKLVAKTHHVNLIFSKSECKGNVLLFFCKKRIESFLIIYPQSSIILINNKLYKNKTFV